MPLSFPPDSAIIQPIVHQLATALSSQIPGLGFVYEQPPDKAVENKAVLIVLRKFKIEGDTNAKLYVRLTFGIYVLFRPTKLGDDIAQAYTYLNPVLQVLAAWPNQTLTDSFGTDHAIEVCPTDGGVTRWPQAATGHLALVVNCDVLTEFNIATH